MEAKHVQEFTVAPGMADDTGRLGEVDALVCFMNIATEHATELGLGFKDQAARHQYWLTVKTKAHFARRPGLEEKITLTTWPNKPGRIRCIRNYRMEVEGEAVIGGKSEWAILDTETGKLVRADDRFPEEMEFSEEQVCAEPFVRVPEEFPAEPFGSWVFRSTDIDVGKHVNNVAYVRAVKSLFSCEEWNALAVSDLEISYLSPCFEGETMDVYLLREPGRIMMKGCVEERTAVVLTLTVAE